jgi:hypothetical protein
VGVWSAGGDEYVNEIVQAIKPESVHFEIVWGRKIRWVNSVAEYPALSPGRRRFEPYTHRDSDIAQWQSTRL